MKAWKKIQKESRYGRCRKVWLAVCLSLCIGSLSGCAMSAGSVHQDIPELLEPASKKEATTTVERGDLYAMTEIGVMVVPVTEELSFEPAGGFSGGTVKEILAIPGDMVEEGQVLLRLDSTYLDRQIENLQISIDYQYTENSYALQQAQCDIDMAQLNLDAAKAELAAAQQALTEAQQQTAGTQTSNTEAGENESTLESLEQALETAQVGVDLCDVQLRQAQTAYNQLAISQTNALNSQYADLNELKAARDNLELKAPFSGRVVQLNCVESQWIAAYETLILLADESQMILQGEAYSNTLLMNALKIDAQVGVLTYEIEYKAYDADDYLKRKLNGEDLPSNFVLADTENKTISYGQIGKVRVYSGISEDTLILPIACLHEDGVGYYVYTDENGQKVKTYVSIGIKTTTSVEILDTLKEGDLIYVD